MFWSWCEKRNSWRICRGVGVCVCVCVRSGFTCYPQWWMPEHRHGPLGGWTCCTGGWKNQREEESKDDWVEHARELSARMSWVNDGVSEHLPHGINGAQHRLWPMETAWYSMAPCRNAQQCTAYTAARQNAKHHVFQQLTWLSSRMQAVRMRINLDAQNYTGIREPCAPFSNSICICTLLQWMYNLATVVFQ